MKKVIVGVLIGMCASTSALALGPREQGILTGVAGLWIVQQLARPNAGVNVNGNPVVLNRQPVYVQPSPVHVSPPVYVQQPQQWCESVPVVDQFGGHRVVQYCYYK